MTFELQHSDIPQAKLLDEEVATTQWPMPPSKPWAPKSSIEQMCEEARQRLAIALDEACFVAWMRHCQTFGIQHRMHVAADGTRTVLVSGDEWPGSISEETREWHADSESVWFFEPLPNVCSFKGQP